MSSESEDEFQSADEGSDCEDFQPSKPDKRVLTQSQKRRSSPLPLATDFHEEKADNFNENHKDKVLSHHVTKSLVTQVEEKQHGEELNQNKNDYVEKEIGALVSDLSIEDAENRTLTIENLSHRNENTPVSISSCVDVQKCNTLDNNKSTIVNKEELKENTNSNDKGDNVMKYAYHGFSSEEECKERIPIQVEKIEEKRETSVTDSSTEQEHSSEIVFQEESGNELENTKKGKDISDTLEKVIPCDDIKAEVKAKQSQEIEEIQKREIKEVQENKEKYGDCQEEMSWSNKTDSGVGEEERKKADSKKMDAITNSNHKPIRESKIGMKKPRERLGERLGAKKLGSKIDKKTLEGISSESIIKSKENSNETDKSMPKCAFGMQKTNRKEDSITEPVQDELNEQQWKEQQQRWQEIHCQKNGNKKISSDDTGGGGWGGSWGGWGSTIFSAASTFTREVGRGVETVMETVEGTLGAPDPQTLAREIAEHERELESEERHLTSKIEESQESVDIENSSSTMASKASIDDGKEDKKKAVDYGIGGLSSLGFLVSGVSGALETASSKVLLGGLDTLEVIGRKAMNVIQEGDPGLRKKRSFLANRKPNLSLILQEARQRAEEESKRQTGDPEKESKNLQKPTFYQAWESTEGPVHLEALSLVARQCESKMTSMLQSLPPYILNELHTTNAEIKSACQLDEELHCEGDLMEQVINTVSKTGLPLHIEKINMAWSSVEDTTSLIQEAGVVDGPAVERELFKALAAVVVQLSAMIHKGAELALITSQADPLTVAVHFRELTNTVCGGIEGIADQVCEVITTETSPADPQVNNTITNIYLQATSGNSYVNQSMAFLSSVLQYANTKQVASEVS